ncbi:ATP-binding protein [Nocardioides sp. HDW12B]|uniref:ATP-binding protein n=1 Tax=Nocardioides sp. HDW12B TaxID=2714939 RepID=UPI00140A5230|nr:ATP-binding protein [Nocardioides sp. HDW12B]QIK66653.1 ATP-binding protein [Nocardioides sp. HDW12B]
MTASTTSPAQARAFVAWWSRQHELPDLLDDLLLVVSELVTNAVVHARSHVRIRIEELPSHVRLTVSDDSLERPRLSLAGHVVDGDEHGRGLWLVDACSTDWGTDLLREGGKSTWASFAVRPRRCPGPGTQSK